MRQSAAGKQVQSDRVWSPDGECEGADSIIVHTDDHRAQPVVPNGHWCLAALRKTDVISIFVRWSRS